MRCLRLFEPINTQLVKQLCHTAITLAIVSYGDLVFIQGLVRVCGVPTTRAEEVKATADDKLLVFSRLLCV